MVTPRKEGAGWLGLLGPRRASGALFAVGARPVAHLRFGFRTGDHVGGGGGLRFRLLGYFRGVLLRTVPHGFGGKLLGLFTLRRGPVAGVGVHQLDRKSVV